MTPATGPTLWVAFQQFGIPVWVLTWPDLQIVQVGDLANDAVVAAEFCDGGDPGASPDDVGAYAMVWHHRRATVEAVRTKVLEGFVVRGVALHADGTRSFAPGSAS